MPVRQSINVTEPTVPLTFADYAIRWGPLVLIAFIAFILTFIIIRRWRKK